MLNLCAKIFIAIIAALGTLSQILQANNQPVLHKGILVILVIVFILVIILSVTSIVLDHKKNKENENMIDKQKRDLEALEEIGNAQLRAAMYTSSLDEQIKSIYIKLTLIKTFTFEELCPINFCCFLFKSNLGEEIQELRYIAKDDTAYFKSNKSQVRVDSYLLRLLDKDNNEIHKSRFGYCKEKLSSINLPIYYQGQKEFLLYKLRDFHDTIFRIYLSQDLLDKITRIQFIVNNWGIVDSDPREVFWVDKKLEWSGFDDSIILKNAQTADPKTKDFPKNPWHINLYWHIPLYLE